MFSDIRISVFYSRLGLEHAVYWLYDHDDSLPSLAQLRQLNGRRFLTLDELMNESAFRDLVDDADMYLSLFTIEPIGNKAAHRNRESITKEAVLTAVEQLYGFLLQLAANYQDEIPHVKPFDVTLIPVSNSAISQKEQQNLQEEILHEKTKLQKLTLQLQEERAAFDAERSAFRAKREEKSEAAKIKTEDWTEEDTRIRLIDVLPREAGWDPQDGAVSEYEITGLPMPAFHPAGARRTMYFGMMTTSRWQSLKPRKRSKVLKMLSIRPSCMRMVWRKNTGSVQLFSIPMALRLGSGKIISIHHAR